MADSAQKAYYRFEPDPRNQRVKMPPVSKVYFLTPDFLFRQNSAICIHFFFFFQKQDGTFQIEYIILQNTPLFHYGIN